MIGWGWQSKSCVKAGWRDGEGRRLKWMNEWRRLADRESRWSRAKYPPPPPSLPRSFPSIALASLPHSPSLSGSPPALAQGTSPLLVSLPTPVLSLAPGTISPAGKRATATERQQDALDRACLGVSACACWRWRQRPSDCRSVAPVIVS